MPIMMPFCPVPEVIPGREQLMCGTHTGERNINRFNPYPNPAEEVSYAL